MSFFYVIFAARLDVDSNTYSSFVRNKSIKSHTITF